MNNAMAFWRLTLGAVFLLIMFNHTHAVELGERLKHLSFETKPNDFHYAANGQVQLITIYPAKPSSIRNGKLNRRMQALGICPIAVTDINNKAWYAPIGIVEKEMESETKAAGHNKDCKLSGDYEGQVVKLWGLEEKAVTLVVDGEGTVIFLEYGVLSMDQEQTILTLFGRN